MHVNLFSALLLQANAAAPAAGAASSSPLGGMGGILFPIGMIVVMYFFIFRPQQKRQKEQKKFGENVGINDAVITTSGIHARINKVNDDGSMQLEIARGVFITVEKAAISMEMTSAMRKKKDAAEKAGLVSAS